VHPTSVAQHSRRLLVIVYTSLTLSVENDMQDPDSSDSNADTSTSQAPQLTAIELRVLGALMEKQLTTPDQYPLTVNSIMSACNQKSSREPVSSYNQGEIVRTLQSLEDKRFVRREFGSRAAKYSQQFMQHIELGKKQQAVLCVMMLRGPQTASELGTRTQRMEQFSDKDELTHSIERLCDRELPYAIRLGHQLGQRGERFGHLFCGTPDISDYSPSAAASSGPPASEKYDQDALMLIELEVAELGEKVKSLKDENAELKLQLNRLFELTGYSQNLPSD
jgi:uncharacterized protein YceH (UPF0502 family)